MKHRQARRQRVDEHHVSAHMAVAAALPPAVQRMIAMTRLQRPTACDPFDQRPQFAFDRSRFNSLAEIRPELTF
jgi:hypothetical protein